jgi:hypothetical protein
MDRKPASHLGHIARIVENLGSIRYSISSEPFIHLISDYLRGGSNLRVPDIPTFPKDTRHFPIREWLCLGADFIARRILSCVLQEQKARILRGNWGFMFVIYRFKQTYGFMAVDRVCPEPLSGGVSLPTGKFTGKTTNSAQKYPQRKPLCR